MIKNFFISNTPQAAMSGHYNWWLVLLSFFIVSAACFIAITLVEGLRDAKSTMQVRVSLLGAFFLGAGIWSMHFTGMLAYQMDMVHTYSIPLTALSFVIAIAFSWLAFEQILKPVLTKQAFGFSVFVIGTGIALMHYFGMAAMDMEADLHYRPGLFALSVVIALLAAGAAILIIRQFLERHRITWSILASGVMGLAVCGMHYTGMQAAVFLPHSDTHLDPRHTQIWLVIAVTTVTFALIIIPGFIISLNRLVNSSQSDGRTRSPRWHYVYYVLAGFATAAVFTSLIVTHQIMELYDDSAEINRIWSERHTQIVEISQLAAAANSPDEDVFQSKGFEGEALKLNASATRLTEKYDNIFDEIERLSVSDFPSNSADGETDFKTLLLTELATFQTHFKGLERETEAFFISLRDGEAQNAGAHMTLMDGHLRDASIHLSNAQQIVSKIQTTLFQEQLEKASALDAIEHTVAGFILLMVAIATLYGHRLAQMIKYEEEEKQFQRRTLDLISMVQSTYISSKGDDSRKVFEVLLAYLLKLSHSEYGFVGEVLSGGSGAYDLNIRAASDVGPQKLQHNGAFDYCGPGSVYDQAIKTGEPLIAGDARDSKSGSEKPDSNSHIEHRAAIPIFSGGEVVAIVGLANKPGGYSQKDIVLLDPVFGTIETIIDSINDRRRQNLTNRKLVESEQLSTQITNRLQGILDNAKTLIYMKDARGCILMANKRLCNQFGYPEEEILGRTDYDFLPRKYADELARNDQRILETLQPEEMEEVVAINGRDNRYFFSMKFPLYDEVLGEHIVCGISTDITEIKKAQQSLEESNAWLDSIMRTVPEGIMTVNSDGAIKSANRALCDLFGYSQDEFENSNLDMLLPETIRADHGSFLQHYFDHSDDERYELAFDREFTGRKKDGAEIPLEINLSLINLAEGRKHAIASVRDITQRKRAEEELKRHRDHLQEMVDEQTRDLAVAHEEAEEARLKAESFAVIPKNNPSPVVKLDQDGQIVLFNPAADRLLDDLQEKGLDHPFLSGVLPLIEGDGTFQREITIDDVTYLQTIVVTTVRNSRTVTFYSNDVTPIRKAREAAEKANRMKTEFLANMSHELRTPMHAIISFSRLGMERIDRWNNDRQVENLDRINQSGHRLSGMLNDLLDLTKLEAGSTEYDFKTADVVSIINAAASEIEILANNKKLVLLLPKAQSSPAKVECDRGKIHQVIVNLLSNAIKFTPEGKKVSVDCFDDPQANTMNITIADEGVGIPEEELETVFDKFIQSSKTKTGAGGTGLGLAICKEIVEGHGGEVWAENNTAGGASFHVLLPRRKRRNK